MKHLIVFYYFISFIIGAMGLLVCALSLLKSKDRKLLYFFFCYAALAVFIMINTLYFYLSAIAAIPGTMLNLLMAYLFFGVFFLFLVLIPRLEREITGRTPSRPERLMMAVLPWAALPLALIPLLLGSSPESMLSWVWFDLYDIYATAFYLVFIYSLVRFLIYTLKLKRGELKNLYLTASVVLLVAVPGFILDAYWQFFKVSHHLVPKDFNFTPFVFAMIGLVSIIYSIRYFIFQPSTVPGAVTSIPPSMIAEYQLTEREVDVALYAAQGLTHQQIADKLFIAVSTVRNYSSDMYRKLGVNNKVSLVQKIQHHLAKENHKIEP